MLVASKTQGTSKNRSVDKSIDLQSYIEKARQANQSAIESAGNEIKANNTDVYQEDRRFNRELFERLVQRIMIITWQFNTHYSRNRRAW